MITYYVQYISYDKNFAETKLLNYFSTQNSSWTKKNERNTQAYC